MTTDGVGIAAPAAPEEPKPSSFARIIGVFFSPTETFNSIVRRPDFVVPLVVLFVISVLTAIPIATKLDFHDLARQAIEDAPQPPTITPEIHARQIAFTAGLMKALTFTSPILSMVWLFILAAILFAAFKIFGGEGEFLQALSITVYGWYPNVIRGLLSVAVLLSKKSLSIYALQNPVASNLGYFVSPKLHPMLFALLSSFDIFTFWTMFLLIIGFAAMSRFSRAKAAVIIVSLWAIKVLFAVGAGALKTLRMRAAR